jgi:hypothetical protein
MNNFIFLAQCMDKTHLEDPKTITHLLKISGIDDAFETHVPYGREEYCIAAISHSKPRDHQRIITKLLKDNNIKSVKKLTLEESPF